MSRTHTHPQFNTNTSAVKCVSRKFIRVISAPFSQKILTFLIDKINSALRRISRTLSLPLSLALSLLHLSDSEKRTLQSMLCVNLSKFYAVLHYAMCILCRHIDKETQATASGSIMSWLSYDFVVVFLYVRLFVCLCAYICVCVSTYENCTKIINIQGFEYPSAK